MGIAIIFPAAIANDLLINNWNALNINKSISHSFLSAAPVEEGLKFLILTSVIAKFKDYDDAVDGISLLCLFISRFCSFRKIYYVFSLYGASMKLLF